MANDTKQHASQGVCQPRGGDLTPLGVIIGLLFAIGVSHGYVYLNGLSPAELPSGDVMLDPQDVALTMPALFVLMILMVSMVMFVQCRVVMESLFRTVVFLASYILLSGVAFMSAWMHLPQGELAAYLSAGLLGSSFSMALLNDLGVFGKPPEPDEG